MWVFFSFFLTIYLLKKTISLSSFQVTKNALLLNGFIKLDPLIFMPSPSLIILLVHSDQAFIILPSSILVHFSITF